MLVTLLQAPHPAHAVYNAPCESMVVADLKREVEALNENIRVTLGKALALGNPRFLDSRRFQQESGFKVTPITERLRNYPNRLSS